MFCCLFACSRLCVCPAFTLVFFPQNSKGRVERGAASAQLLLQCGAFCQYLVN